MNVNDIPLPFKHPFGTVVDREYPADRPLVVDLVLADGTKTAETKTADYALTPSEVWDLSRELDIPR